MLREIMKNLYCGAEEDIERFIEETAGKAYAILHAAKEPFHRQAVGYTGRGCPKESPDYLYKYMNIRELALNIIDAPKPEFFDIEMICQALHFIDCNIKSGKIVLVHCNQGHSRAPALCMLYLNTRVEKAENFEQAKQKYFAIDKTEINTVTGIWQHIEQNFDMYLNQAKQAAEGWEDLQSNIQETSAITVFKALGIDVYENEDKTKFRNLADIMSELAFKWKKVNRPYGVGEPTETGIYNGREINLT